MQKQVIGFVGFGNRDLMLLLAKSLRYYERSVLIVDYNVQHVFSSLILLPEGISLKRQVAEYDGIYFTESYFSEEWQRDYDYIFVDFGSTMHREMERCDAFFLVSDVYPHHLRLLSQLCFPKHHVKWMLLRYFSGRRSNVTEVFEHLREEYPYAELLEQRTELEDLENLLAYERTNHFFIHTASARMRELVTLLTCRLLGITENDFWKTVKRHERRKLL